MPQQQTDILQYPSKNMYSRYSSCLYLIYNINNYPVPFFQIAKKDAQGQSDKKSLITTTSYGRNLIDMDNGANGTF